ncbi:MAG: CotH kinase family protein [Cyclobacteriaceae bacterium]|nr:CotH kinase family protein [Cyclobacteriaceae bacterium]
MKTILIFLTGLITTSGYCQIDGSEPNNFPEIRIYISKNQLSNLRHNQNKLILSHPTLIVNHDTANVKEIHTRGKTTLQFKRKSFSVELDKSITIHQSGKKIHVKKFNLLNLSMDKNLWRNRWSFLCMDQFGLFPLFNSFCKIWINDEPQGIYLIVEKPQQLQGRLQSPYMLRRGLNHNVEDEYFNKNEKELAKKYKKQFQSIYSSDFSRPPDSLAARLHRIINLDMYFQFLAFNYLIMNGDYSDEVFFYIEPTKNWFEIVPWDYDDILRPIPHEGRSERNLEFTKHKLFSLEESMDRTIAGNKTLYEQYEKVLKALLFSLDAAQLESASYKVLRELEQLSEDDSMANTSLFLDVHPFDIQQAKEDILISLDYILKRREWILSQLK